MNRNELSEKLLKYMKGRRYAPMTLPELGAALRDLPDVPDIRAEIEEAKSGDGLIAEVSSCLFGG